VKYKIAVRTSQDLRPTSQPESPSSHTKAHSKRRKVSASPSTYAKFSPAKTLRHVFLDGVEIWSTACQRHCVTQNLNGLSDKYCAVVLQQHEEDLTVWWNDEQSTK